LEQGKPSQALAYLDKALDFEPEHTQALLNSAIVLSEFGDPSHRAVAEQRLLTLLSRDTNNERAYFHLGMLAMDERDIEGAEKYFRQAIQLKEDFRRCDIYIDIYRHNMYRYSSERKNERERKRSLRKLMKVSCKGNVNLWMCFYIILVYSALFNLALLLADSQRPLEAAPFLNQLVKFHPDHIKGLILLGDIYINNIKDLDSAEAVSVYDNIYRFCPNVHVMYIHKV